MSNSSITFFPVGEKNGGMVLIKLNDLNKTSILIDCSIGDDLIADFCDINQELRDRLECDTKNRPYVDAFILTHRHDDHLKGFQKHFHLGPLDEYNDKEQEFKIIIRELWSSHNFWKPCSEKYELCEDAKAFNKEMKRRVELFRNSKIYQKEGDRAIIIGEDSEGKTQELKKINYKIGDEFSKINEVDLSSKILGKVLGPIEQQENEDEECYTNKNRQSIIIGLTVKQNDYYNKILLTADAECLVWETLWDQYKGNISVLEYDLMIAPHHCSWHSLSFDSQSGCDDPKVSIEALNALSQKKEGAFIISQSKIIKDSDQDPPCLAAKKEYEKIVGREQFLCTNEYPDKKEPEPIEFFLTGYGPQLKGVREKSKLSTAALHSTKEAYPHG
jgi:ribonuclease BN (tRNA processing enzyme)